MQKILKATCQSPANIAFIKYWGKADPKLRLPQNNSISMHLSNCYSVCTVEFSLSFKKDKITFLGEKTLKKREIERIIAVLDRVRNLAKINLRAKLVTKNNFPKGVGIASSGSGLSAVTVAACQALRLKLNKIELSKLARLASGTACRSIPDGFVEWKKGTGDKNSYSIQIFPPDWWSISDVIAIVCSKMKKVSSTDGHRLAKTSPFQQTRIENISKKIRALKRAIKKRDFTAFGQIVEGEALELHAICLTSQPPILYWQPTTIKIMHKIQEWRETGQLESYFTIDAGPTVHVICQSKDEKELAQRLKKIKEVERVVINRPAVGARIINKHLF